MRIIEPTEEMSVTQVAILIYGDPDAGKTSLGNTARDPLLLAFDPGVYRSGNRKRTAVPESIADTIAYLTAHRNEYGDVIVDTIGRMLDMMIAEMAAGPDGAKRVRNGVPDQQGWGLLKQRFIGFRNSVTSLGKDLIMLAHAKEEKDDDARLWRPDIQGGSAAEIFKASDFVGYLSIKDGRRMVGWSKTDRYMGKDPVGWGVTEFPNFNSSPTFLADLIVDGKAKLGKIAAEAAALNKVIDGWRDMLNGAEHVETLNVLFSTFSKSNPNATVKSAVWALFKSRAKAIESEFDSTTKAFVPTPKQAA